MRARSRALRRLVARLAVVFIAASLTVACTTEGEPGPEPSVSEPDVVAVVEPTLEPTAPPTMEPTAVPTATPVAVKQLLPTSDMRRVPPEPFLIGNTLGRGMALRRAPTSADSIRAWPDGTVLEGLGAQQDARGWTWAWVRDPDGNAGWIPTQFLVRSPDEPPAPLPVTPAPPEIPGLTPTPADAPAPPTGMPASSPAPVEPNVAAPVPPAGRAVPAAQGASQRGLTGLR